MHSTPWQLQSTTRHGPSHPPNHHPHSHPPRTYSKRLLEVHSTTTHEQMIGRARGRWVFVDPGAKPGTAAAAPRQRARRTLTGSATLEALPGWDPAFDVPMALQHNKNNNSQILGLATGPHLDAWKVMALRTTNQVTRSMCLCMCMCARRGTQCTVQNYAALPLPPFTTYAQSRPSCNVCARCTLHTAGPDERAVPPVEVCGCAVAASHGDVAHRPTAQRGDATAAGEWQQRSSKPRMSLKSRGVVVVQPPVLCPCPCPRPCPCPCPCPHVYPSPGVASRRCHEATERGAIRIAPQSAG